MYVLHKLFVSENWNQNFIRLDYKFLKLSTVKGSSLVLKVNLHTDKYNVTTYNSSGEPQK